MARDQDRPNQASNKEKAEGDRWTSEDDTVERRDREQGGPSSNRDEDAGGITNRPLEEEDDNQAAVPGRGESREGAHAGHGRNREENPR